MVMTGTATRCGGWEESGRSCSMVMNSDVSAVEQQANEK
jgi:hypothetical protein